MWPAQQTMVSGTYQHGGTTYSANADGMITVTTFGPVGGVIEGSFSATFMPPPGVDAAAPIMLTGKFRVCHTPDVYVV
jgi:hypothetical protein